MKRLILAAALLCLPAVAATPSIRTVPVVVLDGERSGFAWVYTADQRPIRICVARWPLEPVIPCYVITGREYIGGVEETELVSVALVPRPVGM
jgi:hypothetical protein